MTRFASFCAGWLALLLLAGCGGPAPEGEPPEGFRLVVRLISVDVAVIDSLRLRIHPPEGTRFAAVPANTTFEDGQITLVSDPDSSLVFEIAGDHVRAHSVLAPDGAATHYELQIWSDDPMMREGPLVLGSASRSGAIIAEGTVYLPSWPPPIEVEGECQGDMCTTQIAIECTADASGLGLCTP